MSVDRGKSFRRPLGLLLFWLTGALLASASAQASDSPDPYELITSMRRHYASIRDYTATFRKQERVDGRLLPPETIYLKFQKPFKIYMKWTEGTKAGQEIIYVKGKNRDKVLAHPGFAGFVGGVISFFLPTFAISPDGPTAMKDNLHPITRAGIGQLIESIIHYTSLARSRGELKLELVGKSQVGGRSTWVIQRTLPKNDDYPAHKAILHIDEAYGLPVKLVLHDWSGQLIAHYEYTDLVLNPGLKPIDFEIRNKEYRFGLAPPIIKD